jgi:hypothetical protein
MFPAASYCGIAVTPLAFVLAIWLRLFGVVISVDKVAAAAGWQGVPVPV